MSSLPLHPTMRHPLTGAPIQALWVRPDGRACWPIMGGDGTDDPPAGGDDDDPPAGGDQSANNDTDAARGFPANTAVAEMTDAQQAAYWRYHSKKHENRNAALLGDRTPEQVRAALEAHDKWQREQQTPAEQALTERYEQGKADAAAESSVKAAKAILRANLAAHDVKSADIDEILEELNFSRFVVDGELDTDRLAATAKRYTSGKDETPPRRRDYGAGQRGRESGPAAGSVAAVMAERRAAREGTTTSSQS